MASNDLIPSTSTPKEFEYKISYNAKEEEFQELLDQAGLDISLSTIFSTDDKPWFKFLHYSPFERPQKKLMMDIRHRLKQRYLRAKKRVSEDREVGTEEEIRKILDENGIELSFTQLNNMNNFSLYNQFTPKQQEVIGDCRSRLTLLRMQSLTTPSAKDVKLIAENQERKKGPKISPDYLEFEPIELPKSLNKSQLQEFLINGNIKTPFDEIAKMDKKQFFQFWKHSGYSTSQQKLIHDVRKLLKKSPGRFLGLYGTTKRPIFSQISRQKTLTEMKKFELKKAKKLVKDLDDKENFMDLSMSSVDALEKPIDDSGLGLDLKGDSPNNSSQDSDEALMIIDEPENSDLINESTPQSSSFPIKIIQKESKAYPGHVYFLVFKESHQSDNPSELIEVYECVNCIKVARETEDFIFQKYIMDTLKTVTIKFLNGEIISEDYDGRGHICVMDDKGKLW